MGISRQTEAKRFAIEIKYAPDGMTNSPDTVRSVTVKHDGNVVARFLSHADNAEGIGKIIVNSLIDAAASSVFSELKEMEGIFNGSYEVPDQDSPRE